MSTALDPGAGPFSRVLYAANAVVEFLGRNLIVRPLYGFAKRTIERRLKGYRVRVNHIDTLLPERLPADRAHRVAVIGGGLAGIAAASTLAQRGFKVTLYERNGHLGGKLGAWTHTFDDGTQAPIEHGFHAFFGSYYNLMRFLERIGVRRSFRTAEDYRILLRDGDEMSFTGIDPVPLLNLFHIVWLGIFDWREFVVAPQHHLLDVLLRYDHDATYAALDRTSFEAFARRQRLPERMQLMFNTFSRAFFARADQMSMAALVRSFHLYYLSNDHGLLYEFPDDDHALTLLRPMADHLAGLGVEVRLSSPVRSLDREGEHLSVDGELYDDVVLATDCGPTGRLISGSPIGREAPGLAADLDSIRPVNRYAVWRIWTDREDRADLPFFTVTERRKALDSVCTYHRFEKDSAAWVAANGGGVYELHCYQLPDEHVSPESIKAALLDDFVHFMPGMADLDIRREVLQVRDDFSSFHVGMHARRPSTDSGIERLWLAGDWVKIPVPAMLMEGAFTSGLYAANAILRRVGLREEAIYSVPLRGLLIGNE